MHKTIIRLILVSTLTLFSQKSIAQVGIGTTTPNADAELDITSSTRGVLLPRVPLTNTTSPLPLTADVAGMIVYNTATAGDVTPGFYYNDGAVWVRINPAQSTDWTILGNAGTNPATNFIGTTDAQDFVIRTNNTEKARITSGGDLGIGIAIPTAKAHVIQTAAIDAIAIDHSGTGGNSIDVEQTNTNNGSSALWLRNSGTGRVINADALNTASTANVIESDNEGLGSAVAVFQSNAGASEQAIYIEQDGTGAFSRGIDTYMGAANTAIGYSLFHNGTGSGASLNLSNAANASSGINILHAGTGRGVYTDLTNPANANSGLEIFHAGTGTGNYTELSNAANANIGSAVVHAGSGIGQTIAQTGTGAGQLVTLTNAANTSIVSSLDHDGLGRGQQIALNNATNASVGLFVVHSGTGTGIQSQSVGDAITGFASGATATAGTFVNTNANADTNSLGLFANYSGIGGGAAGGGNAAEISHFGTNGNAVDIFMGDPTAGAAPSASEYSALTVSHSATGTSPTAGRIKSAINASNTSADPTIFVSNGGTDNGDGIQVFVTPNTSAATTGVYSQSVNGALGVGVQGVGGDIGVVGQSNSGGFGLFAVGNIGATGLKPFTIDYPLDPNNKTLRHFAIESNEVLNMYRGIATLSSNGKAVVKLPEYFNTINTNVTYQLTSIGTSVQPYIAKEQANNKFTIAGAPNTKVSWTIHAERNDPVMQYYKSIDKNYSSDITNKKSHEIGKYYTPEAYGKDKTQGIFYDKTREKNYSERNLKPKKFNLGKRQEKQTINSTELKREKREQPVRKKKKEREEVIK